MSEKEQKSNNTKLTDKERILLLEGQVTFLKTLTGEMFETQKSLLEGFNQFISNSKKNEEEILRWSTATEERINKLIVQQANVNLIINTAITLTSEQEESIKQKIKEVKQKRT